MWPNSASRERLLGHVGDRRRDRHQHRPAPQQRRHDPEHLAADERARDDDQAVLPLPVGDEVDVARLVGHRDQALLGELGIDPLGLAEDQARLRLVPAQLGAVGVDGVACR